MPSKQPDSAREVGLEIQRLCKINTRESLGKISQRIEAYAQAARAEQREQDAKICEEAILTALVFKGNYKEAIKYGIAAIRAQPAKDSSQEEEKTE